MNYKIEALFEARVAVNGSTCKIIYGKHINGYFCAIPDFQLSCEMTDAIDIKYNRGKLMSCGLDEDLAQALAEAILYISKNL